jgi:hypothetical protein
MWPPKRWEIESGHIRISSWVQGERRRRRKKKMTRNQALAEEPQQITQAQNERKRINKGAAICKLGFRSVRHNE